MLLGIATFVAVRLAHCRNTLITMPLAAAIGVLVIVAGHGVGYADAPSMAAAYFADTRRVTRFSAYTITVSGLGVLLMWLLQLVLFPLAAAVGTVAGTSGFGDPPPPGAA